MKKTLAGGLAAALVAGGLGLAAGPSQASPNTTTTTRAAAVGPLPLDLCDLLPALCASQVTGPLLQGVDQALVDLLGTSPDATPEQLRVAVTEVVDAVIATLTGTSGPEQTAILDAIADQLQGAGLDPEVLTQVLAGLGAGGDLPTSALGDLVDSVLGGVQELVEGLLGAGGQTPDPTQVQSLVDQIVEALAGGDAGGLEDLVTGLLSSLPGGTALSPSILTDLVDQITTALAGMVGGGSSITSIIDDVTDALNGGGGGSAAAPASATPAVTGPGGFFTTRKPIIRGTGTPGAAVTVRTSAGQVLGSGTVTSAGSFAVRSRNLKIAAYRVTATQVEPGRAASAASAVRTFRVVSAKPVITTKSRKKFKTHRPKITGIAYPRTRIVLRSSTGNKLGSVKVRADGTWTIKSKRLASGTRKVKAVQTGHGKKKTTKVRTIRIR